MAEIIILNEATDSIGWLRIGKFLLGKFIKYLSFSTQQHCIGLEELINQGFCVNFIEDNCDHSLDCMCLAAF